LFCLSVFGRRKAITNPVAWALILIGFVIFFVLTTERTGSTRLLASLGWVEKDIMVAADLTGARISEVSNSYAHRFHWVREFAANYQQKDGNGSSYESPTSSFEDEWYERRRSYIASIIKPNLKGVDFRRAALENEQTADVGDGVNH
jgi:hypothetical protein